MTTYFSYICLRGDETTSFNTSPIQALVKSEKPSRLFRCILSTTPPKVPGDKREQVLNVNVLIIKDNDLKLIEEFLLDKDRIYHYVVITNDVKLLEVKMERRSNCYVHYVKTLEEAITTGHQLTKNKSKLYVLDTSEKMELSEFAFRNKGLEQIYEINIQDTIQYTDYEDGKTYSLEFNKIKSLELPLKKLFKEIQIIDKYTRYKFNIWWKQHVESEEDEYLNLFRNILTENGLESDFNDYLYQRHVVYHKDSFFADTYSKEEREKESENYIDKVLKKNENNVRSDRTKVGTLSSFDLNVRYDLRKYFPLTTTKRMWWNGILHEFLWILSGSTNTKDLAKHGVHIWDANSTREFLDRYMVINGDMRVELLKL
jgi:hypothetical protein